MNSCGHILARPGIPCPKCGRVNGGAPSKAKPDPLYAVPVQAKVSQPTVEPSAATERSDQFQGAVRAPTQEQFQAALRVKARRSAQENLSDFVKQAWNKIPHLADTKLEWNWHHDALCLHLQTMAEEWATAKDNPTQAEALQRIRNLLINIAPGTTKTLITLVFFPAWMWTRYPRWTVRCVSSNPRSIQESSDFSRQLVTSDWYVGMFIPTHSDVCRNPKHAEKKCPEDCEDRLPIWAKKRGLLPWAVRDDKNAVSDWGNTLGGSRRSTGLKAAVTGEHTDWILNDDPHDADQVNSLEERANVISKWDDALFNRVNDRRVACRVVVMQRLRFDDLSGHIIDRDRAGKKQIWTLLVIASEFDPSYTFTTPIGWSDPRKDPEAYCQLIAKRMGISTEEAKQHETLLDPIRFPRSGLDEELKRLTPKGYVAQHGQNPDSDTTTSFPIGWWNWYRVCDSKIPHSWERPQNAKQEPAFVLGRNIHDQSYDLDWVAVTVDASGGSIEEGASQVGILIVGGKGETKRFVLDDCTPGVRGFNDQVDDVKKAVERAVRLTGKRAIRVLVEKKAYGGAVLEVMEKELKKGDFGTVDGRPVAIFFEAYDIKTTMGSKEQRALALEPDLFAGYVYLPEGAAWLTPFLSEFKRFPAEPNDRVDALVQVVERYRKRISWAAAFKKVGR